MMRTLWIRIRILNTAFNDLINDEGKEDIKYKIIAMWVGI